MTDTWRTIPPSNSYPGLVELIRNGRSYAALGSGPAARKAVEKLAEGQK